MKYNKNRKHTIILEEKTKFQRFFNYLSRIIHLLASYAISYCVILTLPSTSSAPIFPSPDEFFIIIMKHLIHNIICYNTER